MTTIRNIAAACLASVPLLAGTLPYAAAQMYCDGDYCGNSYVYDSDYRRGTYNSNYWSSSLPYSYYYPYSNSSYAYNYGYGYYPYPYAYSYGYGSNPYSYAYSYGYGYPYGSYPYSYPTNSYPQYPMNMQGAPQYPSDPTYKNLSDYYKKLSDYYKAQSDYYKKLDDLNNKTK